VAAAGPAAKVDAHQYVVELPISMTISGKPVALPLRSEDYLGHFWQTSLFTGNPLNEWRIGFIDPELLASKRTRLQANLARPGQTKEQMNECQSEIDYLDIADGRIWGTGAPFFECEVKAVPEAAKQDSAVTLIGTRVENIKVPIGASVLATGPEVHSPSTGLDVWVNISPTALINRWVETKPTAGVTADFGSGWWFFDYDPEEAKDVSGPQGIPLTLESITTVGSVTTIRFARITVELLREREVDAVIVSGRFVRESDRKGVWLTGETHLVVKWEGISLRAEGEPAVKSAVFPTDVESDGSFLLAVPPSSLPLPPKGSLESLAITWTLLGHHDGDIVDESELGISQRINLGRPKLSAVILEFGEVNYPFPIVEMEVDRTPALWPEGGPPASSPVYSVLTCTLIGGSTTSWNLPLPLLDGRQLVGLPSCRLTANAEGALVFPSGFDLKASEEFSFKPPNGHVFVLRPEWKGSRRVRVMIGDKDADDGHFEWQAVDEGEDIDALMKQAIEARLIEQFSWSYSAPGMLPTAPEAEERLGYLLVAGASGYRAVARFIPKGDQSDVVVALTERLTRIRVTVGMDELAPDALETLGCAPIEAAGFSISLGIRIYLTVAASAQITGEIFVVVPVGGEDNLSLNADLTGGGRIASSIEMVVDSSATRGALRETALRAIYRWREKVYRRILEGIEIPKTKEAEISINIQLPSPEVILQDSPAIEYLQKWNSRGIGSPMLIDGRVTQGGGLLTTQVEETIFGRKTPIMAVVDGIDGASIRVGDRILYSGTSRPSIPARVMVDVAALGEAKGIVTATIRHLGPTNQWTMAAGEPGESLPLWAPRGKAWLEVHWHHDGDGELVYLREINVEGGDKPQRIPVSLPTPRTWPQGGAQD